MSAPNHTPPPTSRRRFLSQAAATATIAFLWAEGMPDPTRAARVVPTAPDESPRSLSPEAWRTLEAALDRILPSAEGSPGARDVNAIGYLDGVLADPEVEDDAKERVREAGRKLDAHATARGASSFAGASEEVQDAGLATLETAWEDQLILRVLLSFALEAFLGDPIHGANPNEIGWTWAEHRPGYPRPRADWAPRGEGPR